MTPASPLSLAALTRRGWVPPPILASLAESGTTACRIFSSGEAWLERFGDDLLLSYKTESARDQVLMELGAHPSPEFASPRRLFGKFIPRQNADRQAPVLLSGEAGISLESVVQENGVRFALDFAAGYSAGLFIDQRANRAFLRRHRPRRVLNTFAYTCSFSVAAALAGAATLSVDLSKKSLARGQQNFLLNEVDPRSHQFLPGDVLEVLPRLARRGERFDAIILDPPTFSRGSKGKRFQVETDLEHLLLGALEVAATPAKILLSTNCSRLSRQQLEGVARFCLKTSRRGADFHLEPPLPDLPAEFAAASLWLLLR